MFVLGKFFHSDVLFRSKAKSLPVQYGTIRVSLAFLFAKIRLVNRRIIGPSTKFSTRDTNFVHKNKTV